MHSLDRRISRDEHAGVKHFLGQIDGVPPDQAVDGKINPDPGVRLASRSINCLERVAAGVGDIYLIYTFIIVYNYFQSFSIAR